MARKHIIKQDGTLNLDTIAGFVERLDGHDTLVTTKADKSYVDTNNALKADLSFVTTQFTNIGNNSPKGVYATLSALQAAYPTGTTGVYLVTADGKWYYWSGSSWTVGGTYQATGISDYSLVPRQFKYPMVKGIPSKNLFDSTDVTPGYYIAYGSGNFGTNANYSASNFIPVQPSTYYAVSGTSEQCAFYDVNKTYISGLTFTNTPFQTPSNAAYIRMSMLNTQINNVQLEQGNAASPFESFGAKIDNTLLKPGSVKSTNIPAGELAADRLAFIPLIGLASKNLFDKSKVTPGYYTSYGSGGIGALAGYNASEFIAILPNTNYRLSGTTEQLAFYDAGKTYISGLANGSQLGLTPANAYYVRLTIKDSQLSAVQLEQGTAVTGYQAAGISLDMNSLKTAIPETYLALNPNIMRGIISKNLFNLATVTAGFYIANNNGLLGTLAGYNASDWIQIQPNTDYKLSGTTEQGAFYDANKTYISGFTNGSIIPTSPSNAAYIRLTIKDAQLPVTQLEQGTAATSYQGYGLSLDLSTIKTPITEDKLALSPTIVRGTPSKNLFDKSKVTVGDYVAYSTGGLGALAGYNASDWMPVLPSTSYVISGTTEQLAFYDANKTYISGLTTSSQLTTTPANAHFIRLTVKDAQLSSVQVEQGSLATFYSSYGAKVTADQVGFQVTTIQTITKTVKPDGTGDYLSPKLANDAITDASSTNVYNLTVYPGTYTEIGWTLKPHINLVGTDKRLCWLKGEQPDSSDDTTISNTSTIWVNDTNDLQNLTITAKNMRYAVHDESSNGVRNWTRNLKSCYIEHYGNEGAKTWRTNNPASGLLASNVWTSVCAYGMGHSSGAVLNAEDTEFRALFAPFSVHNNTGYADPCLVYLKRCTMTKVPSSYADYAVRVQSLGSGKNDRVILEGCQLNAPIMHNDTPWLGDPSATTHLDFTIEGFGNSKVPYEWSFATGEKDRPKFTDENNRFTASVAISVGQAVCFTTDFTTVRPMTNTDDPSILAGIAMENMNSGGSVLVKTKGFVSRSDLYNYSGYPTFGAKYGVNADSSIGLTSTNPIAIGATNHIKLIS